MDLDHGLDDDDRAFDALREDGWSTLDIRDRAYLDADGRYAGPKDGPGPDVRQDHIDAAVVARHLLQGATDLRADMKAQGIHVGINGTCAVDDEPWPCFHQQLEHEVRGAG